MNEKIISLIQKYEQEIKNNKNQVFAYNGISYKEYMIIEKIYVKHIHELKNLLK